MYASPGRRALLFRAGGVPLALPLGEIREIARAGPATGEVRVRGEPVRAIAVAEALGLPGGAASYVLALAAGGAPALLVDALHGIADLAEGEVFQLPARTALPAPVPFRGAFLLRQVLWLELEPGALEGRGLRPRSSWNGGALPEAKPAGRELVCERGTTALAVPIQLLVQVVEPARVHPIPLAPPGLRGVLYHGRALHPVLDAAVLLGERPTGDPGVLLLLDAGGATAGVLVDRVRRVEEGEPGGPVRRPAWDALDAVLGPVSPG
jgi:chemotaxis signal transduction protein